jgi:putative redox protein
MPEGTPQDYAIRVEWEGGMRYRGGPEGGPTHVVDGGREAGPSPVDSVLVSLAACSAIDVVEILEKRRTPPRSLAVTVRFSRAPNPPRRVTDAHLVFRVDTDSERAHVERAVELSFQTYCSVAHTIAPDTRVTWAVELGAEPLQPEVLTQPDA